MMLWIYNDVVNNLMHRYDLWRWILKPTEQCIGYGTLLYWVHYIVIVPSTRWDSV
jgi:hypothetical protein